MEQRHKWAKEIIAWLNGEKVQWADVDCENWQDLNNLFYPLVALDNKFLKFRIALKTININGHEVPEPCREELEYGTKYFYPCPSYPDLCSNFAWHDDKYNLNHLKTGFVHLTKEAAIKHAEALLSFTKSEEK